MKIKYKVAIAVTIGVMIILFAAVRYGFVKAMFSLKPKDFFLYPKICSYINFDKQKLYSISVSEENGNNKIHVQVANRWLWGSDNYLSCKEIFDCMIGIYDELSVYKDDVNVICTEYTGEPTYYLVKNFLELGDNVAPQGSDFNTDYVMKRILDRDIYYADIENFSFNDSSSSYPENDSLRYLRARLKSGEKTDLTNLHSLKVLDVILIGDGEFSPHDISGIDNLEALVIEIRNDNISLDGDSPERYYNIKDLHILKTDISKEDLDKISVYFPNASIITLDNGVHHHTESFDIIKDKYFN